MISAGVPSFTVRFRTSSYSQPFASLTVFTNCPAALSVCPFHSYGCEYDEVLNLTVNAGTPADVTDLTVCEAELPYEWNGQTLSAAGQLVNTVSDANGCEYDEVLNLTVNAGTPAEVTDLTICEAELPYEWNGQTLNTAGQLINTVSDANGCEYDEVLNPVSYTHLTLPTTPYV